MMMFPHVILKDEKVRSMIRRRIIRAAANKKLKIYGRLDCRSGKKMKKQNRIFFNDREEATFLGFRPCAHCMRNEYQLWKNEISRRKNSPVIAV